MKNLLHDIQRWMMLALMMVGIQSCTDELQDVDDVQVSFTATLPSNTHARSFGDAGQINTLVVGVFNGEKEVYRQPFAVENTSVDVQLALAKNQTYSLVFWAYNDTQDNYDITNLKDIKMNASPNPITFEQAEAMDAFFAVKKDITITGSNNYPVELVRPLAQINVGTNATSTQATFTIKSAPDTFHPFTNTVSGTDKFIWNFTESTTETFSVDGTEYDYLAMGYLFAPIEGQKIEATLTIGGDSEEFEEVTIQANRRTNIAGDFIAQE